MNLTARCQLPVRPISTVTGTGGGKPYHLRWLTTDITHMTRTHTFFLMSTTIFSRIALTCSDTKMRRLYDIDWAFHKLWGGPVRFYLPHEAMNILDVGCGCGIWAKEMARGLPRSRIIGVDLSPVLIDEPDLALENLSFQAQSLFYGCPQFTND